jgi:hypothetical protein
MKIIKHDKEDVTDNVVENVPNLYPLQIRIIHNKVVQIPETENERKIFAITCGFGSNPSKREYYSLVLPVTVNFYQKLIHRESVTVNLTQLIGEQRKKIIILNDVQNSAKGHLLQSSVSTIDNTYLLHNKNNILDIWNKLNTSIMESEKCCICGKSNVTRIPSPYGVDWVDYERRDFRLKTCRKKECKEIYDLFRLYFRRWVNKINLMERRFNCYYCKKEYTPKRADTKFCSLKCRVAHFRKSKQNNKEVNK